MYKFFHFEAMHFRYHKAQLVSAATRFLLNAFSTIFKLKTTDNSILHLTSKLKKRGEEIIFLGGKENRMLKIGPLESVYISYQMSTPFSFLNQNSVYFTADGQQVKILSKMFASCMNSVNSALHFMFCQGENFPLALIWLFQRNMLPSLKRCNSWSKIRWFELVYEGTTCKRFSISLKQYKCSMS